MAINPERQATVFIKDTSKNLLTSLKSEVNKKDEIIQHQDKLIREYRDTLESREKELLRLQAKIRYYEGVVLELRQQLSSSEHMGEKLKAQSRPPTGQHKIRHPEPKPAKRPQSSIGAPVPAAHTVPSPSMPTFASKPSLTIRILRFLKFI